MSGILTQAQAQNVTDQFKAQIDTGSNVVYVFIGKAVPWPDDTNVPDPKDTTNQTQLNFWKDIIALKKVTSSYVSYGIPKETWISGRTYTEYSSSNTFITNTNPFYVVTDNFDVYKCLCNNKGGTSTVKPIGRPNTSFQTSDSYRWKYMYTVQAADSSKFLTSDYIPVKHLLTSDGSNQWNVQQTAANCAIEVYHTVNGGNNYPTHSGTAAAGNTATLTLAVGASGSSGKYVGSAVYITSGTGIGQYRTITGYNGINRKIVVDTNWSVIPDTTSAYVVSPKVNITGDGSGATAYALMSNTAISKVLPVTIGSNYSFANITLTSNTGSGAIILPQISPIGGHGSNPVKELDGSNIILDVVFSGTEANTILTHTTFRQVGIIVNPTFANNSLLTASTYDNTTKLNLLNITGTFTENEYVVGSSSQAKGYLVYKKTSNTFVLTSVTNHFSNTETITGQTSSATAKINGITKPTPKQNSGSLIYLENRSPVTRSDTNEEDVRLVLTF